MIHLLPHPQGSPEWLALRGPRPGGRALYGASETPQIGGLIFRAGTIWRAKLGHPEIRDDAELLFDVGHALEPVALRAWARKTGRPVKPGPTLYQNDGWLSASLDGESDLEPVEAKYIAMGHPSYALWTPDTIPGHVVVQGLQQVALVEEYTSRRLDAFHVTALVLTGFGLSHRVYRIPMTAERRDLWGDRWAPYPAQWHAAFVDSRTPPPDAEAADVAVLVDTVAVTLREPREGEAELLAAVQAAAAARTVANRVATEADDAYQAALDPLARSIGPDHRIAGARWVDRSHRKQPLPPLLTLEK